MVRGQPFENRTQRCGRNVGMKGHRKMTGLLRGFYVLGEAIEYRTECVAADSYEALVSAVGSEIAKL